MSRLDESAEIVDDAVLCALLEAVTVMYLRQRGPLARDLIVGAQGTLRRRREGLPAAVHDRQPGPRHAADAAPRSMR